MDDYISRQAAIDFIDAGHLVNPNEPRWSDNEVVNFLKSRPPAQPHITHCAECIHWKHSAVRKSYCDVFDWVNEAEDFCSFAERRTNGVVLRKGELMAEIKLPIYVNLPDDWKEQVIDRLRNDPEAEWVEIVRCKDCKYWIAHDKRCVYLNHGFAPNMWCCHGERRTDG